MNRSLLIALFSLLAVTARAQTVATGDAAVARFDLDAASAAYRAVLEKDAADFEATWKLARTLADKGTLTKDRDEQKKLYVEAEKLARAAVRLKENDSQGHTYLAIAVGKLALFEGGKKQVELSNEVKAEAARAVEINARDDLAYHVLGVWNREMVDLNWMLKKFAELLYGKFPPASMENAVTYLERAAEIAPERVAHHVELGLTYATARQWKKADAALSRALAMPKSWVTDEFYKDKAKATLERVKTHLD